MWVYRVWPQLPHRWESEVLTAVVSAFPPVSWPAALVRNSKHCHGAALNFVMDRVRKAVKSVSPDCVRIFRPHQCIDRKSINYLKCLGSKRVSRNRAASEVPKKGFPDFFLCLGKNFDYIAGHKALNRALASSQETALTVPDRSAACRARISCRHASAIEESSLPSRLSISATVNAERSSGGNPRASSRIWSMWVFMSRSLAPKFGSVTSSINPPPNPRFEGSSGSLGHGVWFFLFTFWIAPECRFPMPNGFGAMMVMIEFALFRSQP